MVWDDSEGLVGDLTQGGGGGAGGEWGVRSHPESRLRPGDPGRRWRWAIGWSTGSRTMWRGACRPDEYETPSPRLSGGRPCQVAPRRSSPIRSRPEREPL